MQPAKRALIFAPDTARRDHEEVAVACGVATAERERPREIDADDVLAQDRLDVTNEVGQKIVEVKKRRRACILNRLGPVPLTDSVSKTQA